MSKIHYSQLTVWQKAMQLTEKVYRIIPFFPLEERYALAAQIRRAAVSIPSNIAEGCGRQTDREFRHFLYIARGSVYEVETQLHIAIRQSYITTQQASPIFKECTEVAKMLYFFAEKLEQ